jgi:shikimate kinase
MRRGIGSAQPLDLKSTAEIRSADEQTLTDGPAVSTTEEGGRLTSQAQRQGAQALTGGT